MHTYMHSVYVHMNACVYEYVPIGVCTIKHMCIYMSVCLPAYLSIHPHVQMYTYIYVCVCMCVYIIYIYICIYV